MATLVVRRPANRPDRSVIYARPVGGRPSKTVCKYWLQGRCNKAFCRFLHSDASPTPLNHISKHKSLVWTRDRKGNASNDMEKSNPTGKGNANTYTEKSNATMKGKMSDDAQKNSATGKGNASNDIDKRNEKSNAAPEESNASTLKGNEEKSNAAPEESNASTLKGNEKCNASTLKGNEKCNAAPEKSTEKCNTAPEESNASTVKSNEKCNAAPTECNEKCNAAPEKSIASQNCQEKDCKLWVGNCGDGFSILAKLQGHNKAVTGIALPERTDKLYSVGKDEAARIWDCHTGQCVSVIDLGGEAGCLISEGPWVFIGVPNLVKAWNTESKAEFNLDGPVGQVHAMAVAAGYGMLFAGAQDGLVYVWKGSDTKSFIPAATLKGHTGAVLCLTAGSNRLYSGSLDHTIAVWDLETFQGLMKLNGHSGAVTSLICWHQFLLSGSLDGTIKVWAVTEGGIMEVIYTHNVDHNVLDLAIMDIETNPILLCSCNDNSVRSYELPSFGEKGRFFGKQEVRRVGAGPGGLFFSGDASGLLSVWKWMEPDFKVETS